MVSNSFFQNGLNLALNCLVFILLFFITVTAAYISPVVSSLVILSEVDLGGLLHPEVDLGGLLHPEVDLGGLLHPEVDLGGLLHPEVDLGGLLHPEVD